MKKTALTIALSISLLILPSLAFAESDTITVTPTTRVFTATEKKYIESKGLKEDYVAKILAERESYKEKLKTIKDERKKSLVEKINNGITNANKNRTTEMSESLKKMNSILERISSKAAVLKSEGKDTTSLDASITTAKASVTSAQSAVAAQAAKEYPITITSEEKLKTDINPVVLQFKTDIKATFDKVLTAKKDTYSAARALGALTQLTTTPTITSTP